MKEYTSSVSPKGQVTIPVEVRRRLGIKARDRVTFQVDRDEIRLVPATMSLESAYASIPPLSHPIEEDDLERIAQEEWAARAMQKLRGQ